MIKPVYTIPEATPMKFYKFLTKFSLPLGMLLSFGTFITYASSGKDYLVETIFTTAHIFLLYMSFHNLRKMEWSGVRFLYIDNLLSILYNFIWIVLISRLSSEISTEFVSRFLASSIILLLNWIYFSKRRLLFSPAPPNNEYFTTKEICEDETPAEIGEAPVSPPELEPADTLKDVPVTPSPNKRRISLSIPACIFSISIACISTIAIGYLCYSTGYQSGYDAGNESGYDKGHSDGYSSAESKSSQTISDLRTELEAIEDEFTDLQEYYDILSTVFDEHNDEYWFYHSGAVIVTTTGSKYHHYGCPHLDGRDFYIFNIENAEYQGYSPCLDCWDE